MDDDLERKVVSGIVFTLLLIGTLTLAFNIQPAKSEWTGTVYIRADGSIDPPDAPIITYDNITYTLTDNITSSADGIVVERDNIVLDGADYTLQGTGAWYSQGIYLLGRSNVTIKNTNIKNFEYGIWLDGSSNNSIVGNHITANNRDGIKLEYSNNNSITGNNIANNGYDGIDLSGSSNNTVSGNSITANNFDGIDLSGSSNNTVSGNSITANNGNGIKLYRSSNNSIVGNNVTANNKYGIELYADSSSDNSIYHNNFINNTKQAYIYTSGYANFWDDGTEGNYWSDYTGIDANGDGIGDTPYVIDEDNQDNYPLIRSPFQHELTTLIVIPSITKVGVPVSLNATVTNRGLSDESNVELVLLIDGAIADTKTISFLQSGDFYILSHMWTPTVEGKYNITAYASPVPEEIYIENNQDTKLLIVCPASPPALSVRVSPKTGPPDTMITVTVQNPQIRDSDELVGLILYFNDVAFWSWSCSVRAGSWVTMYKIPQVEPGDYTIKALLVDLNATGTATFTVLPPPPPPKTGVKAGDWIKYDYTVTGWPAGQPYPEWLKVEFLSVEETNATVRVIMHMSNGTEQNATVLVDVVAGGQALGLSGFIIPANYTAGYSINIGGAGTTFPVTLAGETTRTYAGASRTVVYASFSQYGTQLTYYWDKQTGVMVEATVVSGTMTGTAKAMETNMWEAAPPAPFWMEWWLWTIVAVVIVALAGAVYFLKKRKPPTPTAPTSATEST